MFNIAPRPVVLKQRVSSSAMCSNVRCFVSTTFCFMYPLANTPPKERTNNAVLHCVHRGAWFKYSIRIDFGSAELPILMNRAHSAHLIY